MAEMIHLNLQNIKWCKMSQQLQLAWEQFLNTTTQTCQLNAKVIYGASERYSILTILIFLAGTQNKFCFLHKRCWKISMSTYYACAFICHQIINEHPISRKSNMYKYKK